MAISHPFLMACNSKRRFLRNNSKRHCWRVFKYKLNLKRSAKCGGVYVPDLPCQLSEMLKKNIQGKSTSKLQYTTCMYALYKLSVHCNPQGFKFHWGWESTFDFCTIHWTKIYLIFLKIVGLSVYNTI